MLTDLVPQREICLQMFTSLRLTQVKCSLTWHWHGKGNDSLACFSVAGINFLLINMSSLGIELRIVTKIMAENSAADNSASPPTLSFNWTPPTPGNTWFWSPPCSILGPLRRAASFWATWMRRWPSAPPWSPSERTGASSLMWWQKMTYSIVSPSLWVWLFDLMHLFLCQEHRDLEFNQDKTLIGWHGLHKGI